MVDLAMLEGLTLSSRPMGQLLVANTALTTNYKVTQRVEIVLEGLEHIPAGRPVIYAMNHTDRYNYWPFQYQLQRQTGRFTATWVKAKYFEHPLMRWFMLNTNNLPTVSRGYLIAKDCLNVLGRRPTEAEYEAMRHLADDPSSPPDPTLPLELLARPRELLGMRFEPSREPWGRFIGRLFNEMMARFVALNRHAMFDKNLDLLIFPQGTRSTRLSRGHMGLGAMALHLGATIIPVGCSGSDRCYPGASPWARSGRVVYRIGAGFDPAWQARYAPDEPFIPFTPEAEARWKERFQGLVDEVMERIDQLVDPPYRFSDDRSSDGVQGAARFV